MKVECRHISANANPKPNSLLFLDHSRLLYAFSNQVALYHVADRRVLCTIHDTEVKHGRTNCIALLPGTNGHTLICGYDTGWMVAYSIIGNKWARHFAIQDQAGLISISHIEAAGRTHIFTNNNNSTIRHYQLQGQTVELKEEIKFPLSKIIESIALFTVEEKLMLFLGGVDQKIHYYELLLAQQQGKLEYRFSLTGHENSITKLAIAKDRCEGILLASASKDGYIRIWKITSNLEEIKFHKNVYPILADRKIFLEAVLVSHQCSVTSLSWVQFGGILQLASSSLDCTVCLWGNATGEAWSVESRMGQFIGNKNAYFDVLADPSYRYLVALNYTGASLMWEWRDSKFSLIECFNGHSNAVKGLEWNHSGDFLVSASKDQTTRVIALSSETKTYHEISRAQIHGYDINAVTVIKVKDSVIDLIVCGADEKVIRILEPPACFANYLNTFTKANLHLFFTSQEQENRYKISKPEDRVLLYEAYSEGGTQVLGLMTKAQRIEREKITSYYEEDEGEEVQEIETEELKEAKLDYDRPPHEDYLVKHTLWPQMNKLYGHPHEIEALCRSRSSRRMASSCTALNKQAASVIVWNTDEWTISKILSFHNYTVFALQFSLNDKYFASVSKDRKLAVYSGDSLQLLYSYEAHLRTITCLSFHKSQNFLLTGSRDKTIRLHSLDERKIVKELHMKFPVTAIEFCNEKDYEDYFAVGCANGLVSVGRLSKGELEQVLEIDSHFSHTECVNKIKWKGLTFATCSEDFSVRIFDLIG